MAKGAKTVTTFGPVKDIDEVNSVAGLKKESIYLDEEEEDGTEEVVFSISKAVDRNLVSGWASVAIQADGDLPFDWQADVVPPEVLERAAIKFMEDYRTSGVQHEGDSVGIIVESIVFTKEKMEAIGIPAGTVPEAWFITVKINDPVVFAQVKTGQLKMFSIQGRAKRLKF